MDSIQELKAQSLKDSKLQIPFEKDFEFKEESTELIVKAEPILVVEEDSIAEPYFAEIAVVQQR